MSAASGISRLLFILSACWLQAALAQPNARSVRFEIADFCPSPAQLSVLPRRLSGTVAMSSCAVECATMANCSAMYRSGSDCYLAGRSDWQDAWRTDIACRSNGAATLVRLPTAPATLTDRLVVWLSLRASLANLANGTARPAELTGPAAFRNASGVVLPSGSGNSYLLLPPPDDAGLEARRGPLGQFAVFVKADWQSKLDGNSTYLFRAASPSDVVAAWIYEESRRIKFGNRRASTSNLATGAVLPAARSVNSIGISFNGSYSAYVNGKPELVSQYSTLSASEAVGSLILLGARHKVVTDDALKGRIICFAYWAREVALEEFAAFDSLC